MANGEMGEEGDVGLVVDDVVGGGGLDLIAVWG